MTIKLHVNRFDLVTFQDGYGDKQALLEIRAVRVSKEDGNKIEPDAVLFMSQATLKALAKIIDEALKASSPIIQN